MSATIDERVVEMRFDNRQFESRAEESLDTLDKLKKALNFSDSSKGFENIEKAANKVDFNILGNAIDSVKVKFSALEVAALTVFSNMVNRAVDAGVNIAKSLTIGQIMPGYNEYELKLNSVQTIMNSTGADLKTVNKYLEELNQYADKTIYSFSDMTSSIGKFTNAGVDLDTAVKAIQGVSNAAAYAGSNAQQASSAMYNFSQALSTGFLGLVDWKSIELAGMATQQFKEVLTETGLELGTLVKEGDKYITTTTDAKGSTREFSTTMQGFRDSLTSQWITTEVLTKALSKYSDESTKLGQDATKAATQVKTFSQLMDTLKESVGSGWAQTFEIIVGNFNEAKELWTGVNDVIGGIINGQAEARNALFKEWRDRGGRIALLEALQNSWEAILALVKPIKEAFREIFPAKTAKDLVSLTKSFRDFTKRLIISGEASEKVKTIFKGLFSVADVLIKVFGTSFKIAFGVAIDVITKLADVLSPIAVRIGEVLTKFNEWVKENDIINKVLSTTISVITGIIQLWKEWISEFMELPGIQKLVTNFQNALNKLYKWTIKFFEGLPSNIEKTKELVKNFIDSIDLTALQKVYENVKKIFENIKDIITNNTLTMQEKIKEIFELIKNFDFKEFIEKIKELGGVIKDFIDNTIGKIVGVGAGLGFVAMAVSMIKVIEKISEAFEVLKNIGNSVIGVLNATSNAIKSYTLEIKSKALLNVAISIGILAASIALLAQLDTAKLAITAGILVGLAAALIFLTELMSKKMPNNIKDNDVTKSLLALAGAILVMAISLKAIESLDPNKLGQDIVVLAIALGSLIILIKALNGVKGKDFLAAAGGVVAIVLALRLYVSVIKTVSNLQFDNIGSSIAKLAVVFLSFIGLIKLLGSGKSSTMKAGVGAIAMSLAIGIIIACIKSVRNIETRDLVRGIATVEYIMLLFTAIIAVSFFAGKNAAKAGIMLLGMSAAILIMVGAVAVLSLLDPADIAKGVIAITALQAMFALLIASTALAKECKSTILMIGITIGILAGSLALLSLIKAEDLFSATTALSIVMAAFALIVASTGLVKKAKSTLIILDASIVVLTACLYSLAKLPVGSTMEVAKSLSLLLLSLSASLLIISKAKSISVTSLIALATLSAVVAILAGILGLLVYLDVEPTLPIAESLSLLLISMSAACVILAGVGALSGLAITGVTTLITLSAVLGTFMVAIGALLTYVPDLETFLDKGIDVLIKIAEAIGKFFGTIIDSFLTTVTKNLPKIADNLSNFMVRLTPFIVGAKLIDTKTVSGVGRLATVMFTLTGADLLTRISDFLTGGDALGAFANALADLGPAMAKYADCVKDINPAKVTASASAAQMLAEMADTLPNNGGVIAKFLGDNSLLDFADALKEFGPAMAEYANSVSNISESKVTASAGAAKILAEMADTIPNSGGKWAEFWGDNKLSDFAEMIPDLGVALAEFSTKIDGITPGTIEAAANSAKALAEFASALPNSGGAISYWTGDNKLSDFAEDLPAFGKSFVEYYHYVKDIKFQIVEASAAAAQSLAEFNDFIPNQGGFLSYIVGDNTMSDFGDGLQDFGYNFARYYKYVKDIKPGVVTTSADVARSLAALNDAIPNQGGFISYIVGDNTFEDFGAGLASFGAALKGYSDALGQTSLDNVADSIDIISGLVTIAKDISSFSSEGMYAFSAGLLSIANNGIASFTQAFVDSQTSVESAIDTMFGYAIGQMEVNQAELGKALMTIGVSVPMYIALGVTNGLYLSTTSSAPSLQAVAISVASCITTALKNNLSSAIMTKIAETATTYLVTGFMRYSPALANTMKTVGSSMVTSLNTIIFGGLLVTGTTAPMILGNGMNVGKQNAINAATSLGLNVYTTIKSWMKTDNFYNMGKNAATALANGMIEKSKAAYDAAAYAGKMAADGARNKLEIHSPSRVFTRIGENVTTAFANAILSKSDLIYKASSEVSESAIDPVKLALNNISNSMEDDINYNPVITPVIDLTNVVDGANKVSTMFGGLNLGVTSGLAQAVYTGFVTSKYGLPTTEEKDDKVERKLDKLIQDTEEKDRTTNYNTFNIQSTDPKAAANEISYIMQHRVERSRAVWGR